MTLQHLGFLVLASFVSLAPSPSIMPTTDLAVEHRVYLPLILLISGGVIAFVRIFLDATCCVGSVLPQGIRIVVSVGVLMGTCFTFGCLTRERVDEYQFPILLWQDALAKRQENARTHHNLGVSYLTDRSAPQPARPHLQRSLELRPVSAVWWLNLAECQGQSKCTTNAKNKKSVIKDECSAQNLAATMQARWDVYRQNRPHRDNGLDQDDIDDNGTYQSDTYQTDTGQDGVTDRGGNR